MVDRGHQLRPSLAILEATHVHCQCWLVIIFAQMFQSESGFHNIILG